MPDALWNLWGKTSVKIEFFSKFIWGILTFMMAAIITVVIIIILFIVFVLLLIGALLADILYFLGLISLSDGETLTRKLLAHCGFLFIGFRNDSQGGTKGR